MTEYTLKYLPGPQDPSRRRPDPADGVSLAVRRRLEVDVKLLQHQRVEGALVARVHPPPGRGALLVRLPLAEDAPVVALGPADGGREPYLLVGGLLVEHVGAHAGDADRHDARLHYSTAVSCAAYRMELLW